MKKYFWLMLFALLIIAFSATAYAADLKAAGYLRYSSLWFRNVPQGPTSSTTGGGNLFGPPESTMTPGATPNAFDKPTAYMMARARLRFDVVADKNLSGAVYFEIDSDRWGDIDGTRNKMGYWNADRASVEVKDVYIDVGLPYFGIPAPVSARIGLQAVPARTDAGIGAIDGMGINWSIKADPVLIQPFWFKAYEGLDASSDDADLYGLRVQATIDKYSIGAFGYYLNANQYPIPTTVGTYGAAPVTNNEADMFWIDLYSDGVLGPANYKFDFITNQGKVKSLVNPALSDVDYSGWTTRLRLVYPWEQYEFGFVGMYASGASQKKTDGSGVPGTNATPWGGTNTKSSSYVYLPGCDVGGFGEGLLFYDTYYDHVIESYTSGGTTSGNAGAFGRGGTGGTWMAKLFLSNKVQPWWKVTLQGMYIGDTTEYGNTIGNARTAAGKPRDDNIIGWELGVFNDIQIYKGLDWYVTGAYLYAGDALDYYKSAAEPSVSPKNPWQICTTLIWYF
jgi:hypothetical protein